MCFKKLKIFMNVHKVQCDLGDPTHICASMDKTLLGLNYG
jgi:hypothetical protein